MSYSAAGRPIVGEKQHGGWGFQILSYTEEVSVWQAGSEPDNISKSVFAWGALLSWMFCPTRREPESVVADDWLPNPRSSGRRIPHAKNDYVASAHDISVRFRDGTTFNKL